MLMQYTKPTVLNHKLNMFAHGQYTLIVTLQSCPGLASFTEAHLTGDTFAHCDNDPLKDIREALPDATLIVGCSNIDGTYTVTIDNSETQFGGGLTCGPDSGASVIAPISVSPELPEDCIVNSVLYEKKSNVCPSNA